MPFLAKKIIMNVLDLRLFKLQFVPFSLMEHVAIEFDNKGEPIQV